MEDDSPEDITAESDQSDQSDQSANSDLLGKLDSLLAAENIDDIDDIDDDEVLSDLDTSDTASKPNQKPHKTRHQRKIKNLQEFKNIEADLQISPTMLEISDDNMTVICKRITSTTDIAHIKTRLERQGITSGIDAKAIHQALSKARLGHDQLDIVVAQGQPAKLISPAKIKFHFPKDLLTPTPENKLLNPFEELSQAFQAPVLDHLKSWDGPIKIVNPGDILTELVPSQKKSGFDVFGTELNPVDKETVLLHAGKNTSLTEASHQCIATIYGYAGLLNNVPTVLSPLWISADLMNAFFIHLPPLKPFTPPSIETLHELLKMHQITFGVMKKQLRLLQQRLEKQRTIPVALLVARGKKDERGQDAQFLYTFDNIDLIAWDSLQNLLNLQEVETMQAALNEICTTTLFKAVKPTIALIEKIPSTQGIAGQDIQGKELYGEAGTDTTIEIGDGLISSEDEHNAITEYFGFICKRFDIVLSLFLPIWIPADKSIAYFLNLPQIGPPQYPSLEEMQTLLEITGIRYGFSPEQWVKRCEDMQNGQLTDSLIPLAESKQPQQGRDAHFAWAIDTESDQPGRILEDGSIDFRERDMHTLIEENDLIGTLLPSAPGVPGIDIFNNELAPLQSTNIEIHTDAQIYAAPTPENHILFYSEIAGGLQFSEEIKENTKGPYRRITLEVNAITIIDSDINYSTGNISFNGDVIVNGSVQAQFSVQTTGSILINGFVENGAYITAGKDIFIQQGINGSDTEVVAGGKITTKFIQEATVHANLDLQVSTYIFNASVRAGGNVEIIGNRSGKLVGGLVWGAEGISAPSIGSPYNTTTRLITGLNPFQIQRTAQLRANIQSCKEKKQVLLGQLDLQDIDIQLLKKKIAKAQSKAKKNEIGRIIKRLSRLTELEQSQRQEIDQITKDQYQLSLQATIKTSVSLWSGVELRIGQESIKVTEDVQQSHFYLSNTTNQLTIINEHC